MYVFVIRVWGCHFFRNYETYGIYFNIIINATEIDSHFVAQKIKIYMLSHSNNPVSFIWKVQSRIVCQVCKWKVLSKCWFHGHIIHAKKWFWSCDCIVSCYLTYTFKNVVQKLDYFRILNLKILKGKQFLFIFSNHISQLSETANSIVLLVVEIIGWTHNRKQKIINHKTNSCEIEHLCWLHRCLQYLDMFWTNTIICSDQYLYIFFLQYNNYPGPKLTRYVLLISFHHVLRLERFCQLRLFKIHYKKSMPTREYRMRQHQLIVLICAYS